MKMFECNETACSFLLEYCIKKRDNESLAKISKEVRFTKPRHNDEHELSSQFEAIIDRFLGDSSRKATTASAEAQSLQIPFRD